MTKITTTGILAVFGALVLSASLARPEIGKPAPEISGQSWLNSKPLTLAELRGKVVLLEFWTFGCVHCRNVEPYLKSWHRQYAGQGLVIVAVHYHQTEQRILELLKEPADE